MAVLTGRAGPLAGLLVVHVGREPAAHLACTYLGDLGATVVRVEDPGAGDPLRAAAPFSDGNSLTWSVNARSSMSATCDTRTEDGRALLRRLLERADIMCESLGPGVLEEWAMGLDLVEHGLVITRVSSFGQTGPNSGAPADDVTATAFAGLLHLTGYPDGPPSPFGVTLVDHLTAAFVAQAALAGIYGRSKSGRGTVVDAPLYGSALRISEWTLPATDATGAIRERQGNHPTNVAPLGVYIAADGSLVGIVAGSDVNFARLTNAMHRPELRDDRRFRTAEDRSKNAAVINDIVTEWVGLRAGDDVTRECEEHDVPVGRVYSVRDLLEDPHVATRGDVETVDDPVLGTIRQSGRYPRFVGRSLGPIRPAPALGADNEGVWCGLAGVTTDELSNHLRRGVV